MEDEQIEYILDIFERALDLAMGKMPAKLYNDPRDFSYSDIVVAASEIAIKAESTRFADDNLSEVIQACLH